MPMEVSVVEAKRGQALMLDFSISIGPLDKGKQLKGPFNIVDTALVWFHFEVVEREPDSNVLVISIQRKKHLLMIGTTVELNVSCKELKQSMQLTCPVDLTYGHEFGTVPMPISQPYSLHIKMFVIRKEKITFENLYDDTGLTDFHLSTEKGSVAVHKACLALHSDMFYTMLLGQWKETAEGRIELKGVSLQTLQHLKQYLYLGRLPEDVRPLLVLAKCYLMDNLKQDCLMKLARSVSSENLYELQEFACANNIIELSRLLMEVTTGDTIHGAYKIEMSEKSLNDDDAENDDDNVKLKLLKG